MIITDITEDNISNILELCDINSFISVIITCKSLFKSKNYYIKNCKYIQKYDEKYGQNMFIETLFNSNILSAYISTCKTPNIFNTYNILSYFHSISTTNKNKLTIIKSIINNFITTIYYDYSYEYIDIPNNLFLLFLKKHNTDLNWVVTSNKKVYISL